MSKTKPTKRTRRTIENIEKDMEAARQQFAELRNSNCYLLLLANSSIKPALVDRVYDDLKSDQYKGEQLEVIVDSGGGDIDPAYNLAQLFRTFAPEKLVFVIPRWAKSAATLLSCGGDSICMTPIAELGPLDPQYTIFDPFEKRREHFSPLHIESTLQLIRDEFESGNSQLAEGLMQRLQFPLTLGRFKKSIELGRDYVERLLTTRMLKEDIDSSKKIAETLTSGYADHSWCITIGEAKELGLKVEELDGEVLDVVWHIHQLSRELSDKREANERAKLKKVLKNIPPELLEQLDVDLIPSNAMNETESE